MLNGEAPDCGSLIDEFVTEAEESLDMAVDDVLSLEQGPDAEAIGRIFRVVHTIKGTAGMLGFDALSGFVHGLEDACADIRSGVRDVDRRTADNLLGCLDAIRARLGRIAATRRDHGDYAWGEKCLGALRLVSAPSAAEARDASPRGGVQGKTLIVEDDFSSRKALHSLLSPYTVCYVAKDGSEAIQAVTESYMGAVPEPFSLIVMNATAPIIDGFRATEAIRALERAKGAGYTHPPATICITSTLDDEETRRAAIRGGADAFLAKPLEREVVRQMLAMPAQPLRKAV